MEKKESGPVSIGGASRLNLRKIMVRLASVNNFVLYYFLCLWCLVWCHTDLLSAASVSLTDKPGLLFPFQFL